MSDPATGGATTGGGLQVTGLRKRYGDTIALDGLDLETRPGEILGLAGPNGAGKSTLVKILAGETPADGGEMRLDGRAWSPAAASGGVALVHQDPQLFPNLSVAENIKVGREGGGLMRPVLDDQERALMRDLAIADVADRPLGDLPLAVQQRTEICRALARDARLFLFDEPNSALTQEESNDLFRRMHDLANAGQVVLLVSHRLAELVAHAHRVAIVLDGRCTAILEGAALTQEAIAENLVVGQAGRDLSTEVLVPALEPTGEEPFLKLQNWSHGRGDFREIDLSVRPGQIVAFVGVEGSGARELVRSIVGVEAALGEIEVHGTPGDGAVRRHTGFVPADRQSSLFDNLSVGENIVSRLGHEIAGASGMLRRSRMRTIANELRERFRVKTDSIHHPILALSGGNQQKVAIAAAIAKRPKVLVLEEPTRGVDVGSKREIYRLMREYANEGHAVIIYCTEIPEVFEAADLVYVVSDGLLSAPLVVMNHPDVESLAREITGLERHGMIHPPA